MASTKQSKAEQSKAEQPKAEQSKAQARTRHVVAAVAELGPGQRKIITIGRREIGIFNIDGEYYALRNVCPHKGAPLCKGLQRPLITSSGINEVAYTREDEIIKCPWHLWEFDIKTGRALHDEAVGVAAYTVYREGEQIILET